MKRMFVLILLLGFSISTSPAQDSAQQDQVIVVMSFSYIRFLEPEKWQIEWGCCPKYISKDETDVKLVTPYGKFNVVFPIGAGLYVCGNAVHLFGSYWGQLPTIYEVESGQLWEF